jgi:hypothetical protein
MNPCQFTRVGIWVGDCTSILVCPEVGYEYRVIDCFQDQLKKTLTM